MSFMLLKDDLTQYMNRKSASVFISSDEIELDPAPSNFTKEIRNNICETYSDLVWKYAHEGYRNVFTELPYRNLNDVDFIYVLDSVVNGLRDAAYEFDISCYLWLNEEDVRTFENCKRGEWLDAHRNAVERQRYNLNDGLLNIPRPIQSFLTVSENKSAYGNKLPDEVYENFVRLEFSPAFYTLEKQSDVRSLLASYSKQKGISPSTVYSYLYGYVSRQTVYRYFDSTCQSAPDKAPLILICIALNLEPEEFTSVIQTAGYRIDKEDAVDSVLFWGIQRGASIEEVMQKMKMQGTFDNLIKARGIEYRSYLLNG